MAKKYEEYDKAVVCSSVEVQIYMLTDMKYYKGLPQGLADEVAYWVVRR